MTSLTFNSDELVTCPYQPNHIVSKRRYLPHLLKCEKDPKSPKLSKCPFDISHRIPPQLLDAHKAECPAARSFVRELSTAKPTSSQQADTRRDEPCDTTDPWAEEAKAVGQQRSNYLVPGLDKKESKVTRKDGTINIVALQACKPAERRRIYEELAQRKSEQKPETDCKPPMKLIKLQTQQNTEVNENYHPRACQGIGRGKPKFKP